MLHKSVTIAWRRFRPNQLFSLLILAGLALGTTAFIPPIVQPSKKDRPTHLARFQTGTYLAANGTKLRVNVDKQLGGHVYIRFVDLNGNLYFDRTLSPVETTARLSLDLAELTEGNYVLKISNGLEVDVREIKITTRMPPVVVRSITIL